jgi:membrane protease subunit (stomatin/prohibitin family)
MGLIKLIGDTVSGGLGAFRNVLHSAAWKEYFESGDMSNGILMKRADRVITAGSRNNRTDNNLISSGSGIDIQEGQCMIIVENGKIVEFCAEPGRYTYDDSIQPSLLSGNNKGLKAAGREVLNQWAAGGQRFSAQRIYFINMGELIQTPIKWGCGDIAFHHTQQYASGIMELDITLKGNGQATIQITDPIKFFKMIGAQMTGTDSSAVITINDRGILSNLKSNIVDNVASAIETLGAEQAVAYTAIRAKGNDIKNIINNLISDEWAGTRGFELASFSVNGSFQPSDTDLEQMREMQHRFTMAQNANMMNYDIQKDIAEGFHAAGKKGAFGDAGHAAILMGAGGLGGIGNIQQQPIEKSNPVQQGAPTSWTCTCGTINEFKFCSNCGSSKSTPRVSGWMCTCGHQNGEHSKFCPNCGSKKPVVHKIVCDKCGWIPAAGQTVKFCPQCGDIINDDDLT